MENEPRAENFFTDLKNLVIDYFKTRLDLARILVYEKIAKIVALLFTGIILTIFLFFALLFASIVAAFYIGNLTGNQTLGFAIIAVFYIILFLVLARFRKKLVEKFIINAVIKILFDEKSEDENS